MATQIGIFAKHWTPGRVKTRLAADIGDHAAADVARLFVETLLQRLPLTADRCVIGYAPVDQQAVFAELGGALWQTRPQCDGDLGQRMDDYFRTAFASGAERVVLLGADSPNLPIKTIEAAFSALESARLVLAPTDDGGYCLVGARREPPPIFSEMPWSEPGLWRATVGRLTAVDWREGEAWQSLPGWYDVDTLSDLERLRSDLSITHDPALERLAAELERVLPPETY